MHCTIFDCNNLTPTQYPPHTARRRWSAYCLRQSVCGSAIVLRMWLRRCRIWWLLYIIYDCQLCRHGTKRHSRICVRGPDRKMHACWSERRLRPRVRLCRSRHNCALGFMIYHNGNHIFKYWPDRRTLKVINDVGNRTDRKREKNWHRWRQIHTTLNSSYYSCHGFEFKYARAHSGIICVYIVRWNIYVTHLYSLRCERFRSENCAQYASNDGVYCVPGNKIVIVCVESHRWFLQYSNARWPSWNYEHGIVWWLKLWHSKSESINHPEQSSFSYAHFLFEAFMHIDVDVAKTSWLSDANTKYTNHPPTSIHPTLIHIVCATVCATWWALFSRSYKSRGHYVFPHTRRVLYNAKHVAPVYSFGFRTENHPLMRSCVCTNQARCRAALRCVVSSLFHHLNANDGGHRKHFYGISTAYRMAGACARLHTLRCAGFCDRKSCRVYVES